LVAITAQSYSSFKVVNKTTGESKQISLSGIPIIDGIDWAPSRNFLLFWAHTKDRKYSIWIVRPDGTQLRKVLEEETLFSARWGPKGTAIYYFRSKGDNDELCKIGINPESGEASGPATVLIGGFQTGQSMTLAAQNSQLAVTKTLRYSNLYVADLSSRQKTSAVQISALTSGTSQYYDPSISPDGQWIAFASGSPSQIYKMPIQGGLPTQLTFYPQGLHRFPVWSPDGKRIAFGSNQGGSSQVWVVDAAGAQPKPFSKTQLSSNLLVRWAPRREIQYQTPSIRNYLLLDPVTEEERPLLKAEVGYLLRLRISPDGKWAAAYWNRAPEGIYLILIADGSAKLLTQGRYYPIGWSPEGKTIFLYYASNTRPQNTIWALSADGGSPRPVLTMPGMILGADITPDGQKFICRLGENKSDVWIVENFDPALKK
jgi:Tol biopolymer transport system component